MAPLTEGPRLQTVPHTTAATLLRRTAIIVVTTVSTTARFSTPSQPPRNPRLLLHSTVPLRSIKLTTRQVWALARSPIVPPPAPPVRKPLMAMARQVSVTLPPTQDRKARSTLARPPILGRSTTLRTPIRIHLSAAAQLLNL